MAFTARLTDSDTTFDIEDGETVLDAALRQGVDIDYGCRHGRCSACKYFLEDGDVDFGEASIYSLSDEEREDGYGLLCCATPLTDLVIESKDLPDAKAKPHLTPESRAGTVARIEQVSNLLWHLTLDLDAPLAFYAGQFVELQLSGQDVWRSYSVASDPANADQLEFVIKHHDGGAFSGHLPTLALGAQISVRGPYGKSYLRDGEEDLLMVATGSGIAPILSMLKVLAREDGNRASFVFYGARGSDDIPEMVSGIREWMPREELSKISICLTQAADDWIGPRGRVTQSIQSDIPDASAMTAYVCGSPEMCETVGTLLEAKGIRDGELHYDKFHSATQDV